MPEKLSKHVKSFQKRWNANWDEQTAFLHFKNRLLFLVDKYLSTLLIPNRNLFNQYAYCCGLSAPYPPSAQRRDMISSLELKQSGLTKTIVYTTITGAQTSIQLAWYLHNLFLVLDEYSRTSKLPSSEEKSLTSFVDELKDLLIASPSVGIRLSNGKKGMIVYPAGAKLLDENLVNENLVWLENYPESLKTFEQALSIYLSGDKAKYRNLIDNLRVAIEQLIKQILGKKKSIENQGKELDSWLEQHGAHKQVRNLYGQLMFGEYMRLQNDGVKHGSDEFLPEEIEYLIYLTGTFMRLLIQLNESKA